MRSNFKVIILGIITVFVLALPVSGQESNQLQATAGVFGTDVDNYMNVNYYDEVEFGKWFGYLGYNGLLNLGYATKIGFGGGEEGGNSIYLGLFYRGSAISFDTDKTTRLTTKWDTNLQTMTGKVDEVEYERTVTYTNNNITALIGIAGMGIKVGFYENLASYNTPLNAGRDGLSTVTENPDGTISYTDNASINYEELKGDIFPYLQWGMKLNLGSNVLAPRVGVGVNFYQDKLIDEYYSAGRVEYQGKIVGSEEINRQDNNNGYLGLDVAVGADYYLDDSMYVGIDYALGVKFYSTDYSGGGKSGSVDGTINSHTYTKTSDYVALGYTEKTDSLKLDITEQSYMSHQIIPAFWKEKKISEDLKVGVLVQLPVTIISQTASDYTDEYQTIERTYKDTNFSNQNETTTSEKHIAGDLVETSVFSISPSIGVGASYALIPGRFTVNAGVNVTPLAYTNTSKVTSRNGVDTNHTKTEIGSGSNKFTSAETETVTYDDVKDSVNDVSVWTGLGGSIAAGFVFSFNENFSLDLLAGTSGFDINLTTVNVLFTVKF
jgi:hypothetical protein